MPIASKDFNKDPNTLKDYTIDWTLWLNGDTIATSSWSVPAGITDFSDSIVIGASRGGVADVNDFAKINPLSHEVSPVNNR